MSEILIEITEKIIEAFLVWDSVGAGSPSPHLPMMPVRYPAALQICAIVVSCGRSETRCPLLSLFPRM